jgi:5'(3')-deoxyribonucleotidase
MKSYSQLIHEVVREDQQPIIMVDLDSVLVDLNKGVKGLTGGYDFNTWKARGKSMADKKGNVPTEVSNQTLHNMITDVGAKFWADLPWMRDGKKLWGFLKNHEVHVLSAYRKPKSDPKGFSKKGKAVWVAKNLKLSPAKTHLVIRDQKKNYVTYKGRPAILIDDYAKNIDEFKGQGGTGIVHTSAAKTISKLKKMGFK